MLLFWLLGPYAADAAINLCNCVYLCLLWPYTTSPARGAMCNPPFYSSPEEVAKSANGKDLEPYAVSLSIVLYQK